MRILTVLFFLPLMALMQTSDPRTKNFPKQPILVRELPPKENFWIFIMAGQSNMAGRGFVEPQDTIPNTHVLTLNQDLQWMVAKEPLHFYEPNLTGLDCGLAFGKSLSNTLGEKIYIGIIPTAIGGSSVEQWLGDSTYRNVTLFSNFKSRVEAAKKAGIIKGILWHQGETNAHADAFKNYSANLKTLFGRFREVLGDASLPVYAGELGPFLKVKEFNHYNDSVNHVLRKIAEIDKSVHVIPTNDLTHKGDSLHFDSRSQRLMGQRFAEKYLRTRPSKN